jgi:hypothetical protein
MTPGPTQPLTEMSTRNLPGGKGRPEHKADKLIAICELSAKKMWEPRRLTNLRASTACYGGGAALAFTILLLLKSIQLIIHHAF